MTTVGTSATDVQEQVEYLLRRDQEDQRRLTELGWRIDDLEAGILPRLDALRQELKEHAAGMIEAVQADYRTARVVGVAFLVVGLGLTAWGNFLM